LATYSVADAKNQLPKLIDQALQGENVVITRHGKPVAELRPARVPKPKRSKMTYEWLRARRDRRKPVATTSVELLRQLYEEDLG
jgi:prevent-host-death family protein